MKLLRRQNQSGFTLTNIIISITMFALVVGGIKIWSHYKTQAAAEKFVKERAAEIKDRFHSLLKFDAAWKFTMNASENALSMSCLRDHATCFDRGGPIALRDTNNRFVFDSTSPANGITIDGKMCSSFSDQGNEGCPFRVELSWKPNCEGTCIDPKSVKLTGKLIFRSGSDSQYANVKIPDIEFTETRSTVPGVPKSCYEHLLAGKQQDGIYVVQPNPEEPGFAVYCDQNRDEGGWALAVLADGTNYGSIPETQLLTPGNIGRLPSTKISAYLNSSNFLAQNNLRFELPEIDGGITLAASTNGAVDGDAYRAPTTPGDCKGVPEKRNIATHTAAPVFSLSFTGPGEAEVSDLSDEKTGFYGFHICFGSDFLGHPCGLGCERKWKGSLVRQKGRIWIR